MALMARSWDCIHSSMTAPSLAILMSAVLRDIGVGDVGMDGVELGGDGFIGVGERLMRPKISERSMGSTVMPLASRSFSL